MVSKQKRKLKIMGCRTAHNNSLSLLLSKADYSTCGTELILRYLLWSLSPSSSCSVSHEFFRLSANMLKSIPHVNPLKQDNLFFTDSLPTELLGPGKISVTGNSASEHHLGLSAPETEGLPFSPTVKSCVLRLAEKNASHTW